jgi:preprotein translocase subunit Sec63
LLTCRLIFLVCGWALFAVTFNNAMNSKVEDTLWNPYSILDIDEGPDFNETKALAKRAYRKLALKWYNSSLDSF